MYRSDEDCTERYKSDVPTKLVHGTQEILSGEDLPSGFVLWIDDDSYEPDHLLSTLHHNSGKETDLRSRLMDPTLLGLEQPTLPSSSSVGLSGVDGIFSKDVGLLRKQRG